MKGAIVGAVSEDKGGKKNGGEVGFFEYGGGSIWNQLDQDITGVAMHDRLGEAVAVAISGSVVDSSLQSARQRTKIFVSSIQVKSMYTNIPNKANCGYLRRHRFIHGADVDDTIGEHGLSWRARCCWITERQAITTMLERVFEPHRVDRASIQSPTAHTKLTSEHIILLKLASSLFLVFYIESNLT